MLYFSIFLTGIGLSSPRVTKTVFIFQQTLYIYTAVQQYTYQIKPTKEHLLNESYADIAASTSEADCDYTSSCLLPILKQKVIKNILYPFIVHCVLYI